MAKYMVDFDTTGENRNEVIKRFVEGSAVELPDGATLVGRFIKMGKTGAWVVVETDNPAIVADWVLRWSDLMDVTVTPVMGDEEAGALFRRHGLG
jgi:hypothetical protein